jgi:hypothetical protein
VEFTELREINVSEQMRVDTLTVLVTIGDLIFKISRQYLSFSLMYFKNLQDYCNTITVRVIKLRAVASCRIFQEANHCFRPAFFLFILVLTFLKVDFLLGISPASEY